MCLQRYLMRYEIKIPPPRKKHASAPFKKGGGKLLARKEHAATPLKKGAESCYRVKNMHRLPLKKGAVSQSHLLGEKLASICDSL